MRKSKQLFKKNRLMLLDFLCWCQKCEVAQPCLPLHFCCSISTAYFQRMDLHFYSKYCCWCEQPLTFLTRQFQYDSLTLAEARKIHQAEFKSRCKIWQKENAEMVDFFFFFLPLSSKITCCVLTNTRVTWKLNLCSDCQRRIGRKIMLKI